MYEYYNIRRKIGPLTILFLFLFTGSLIGLLILSYLDKGKFWDSLPYFCIPIIVFSLVLAIYNLARRCNAGLVFILFFIVFTVGLVLSSIFGPFALQREALHFLDEKDYTNAIKKYDLILEDYPNSQHSPGTLRNISFAYYYNNQYNSAYTSFNKAFEKDIIDPEELQVMDILSDIHFKIAEAHLKKEEYLKAADNYFKSAEILKQIKSDFPDTNEAFIAEYKLPQYLFLASENYNKYGDFPGEIEILQEIITDYPESDFYQEALETIDDAYIDHAAELASNSEYEDAIEWFIKYLEICPEPERNLLLDNKIKKIFKGASPILIKQSAAFAFSQRDHSTAVFLYEILVKYNPDYFGEISTHIVDSKIVLAQSSPYNEILHSVTGKYINTPEIAVMAFQNNTEESFTAYIQGPENYIVEIPPGEYLEIEMIPGEYIILVESEDKDTLSYMGNMLFEEYRKYTEVFEAAEEE
jgi:tetratricopeptide (TPR) repeat protein